METAPEAERRGFYRIDDEIALKIDPLPEGSNLPSLETLEQEIPSGFLLLNEIREIEKEASAALTSVQADNVGVSEYCRSLNRRLDMIANFVARQQMTTGIDQHHVSLSGNGLRFETRQNLDVGTLVKVEMLLPQYGAAVLCYGRVVDQQSLATHDSKRAAVKTIAVEYQRIRESDRDAIVRHVIVQESRQIRASRNY